MPCNSLEVDIFMKMEKAAGFVTFVRDNGSFKVLLLDHGTHISHPKGHIEKNETKLETANRELKEETNLSMESHSPLPVHKNKYTIKKRSRDIKKIVYLYAGIANPGEIIISDEHRRYILLDAHSKQAMDTLTYPADKESLEAALEWLDQQN